LVFIDRKHFGISKVLKIIILGMTKLLVAFGINPYSTNETETVEVIDLEYPSKTCKNLPNFPLPLHGAFGGLGFQDEPIICGGKREELEDKGQRLEFPFYYLNKCFSLKGNEWTPSPSLNTQRNDAAVSPSPYPSKSQKLFVTGGQGDSSDPNTAEVLTEQGWKILPQSLPFELFHHCSVLVNATTVMVIGRNLEAPLMTNTYFFNTNNEIWTKGPPLKNNRIRHSCGKIRKDSQSQELSILVAGGWGGKGPTPQEGDLLSSVEILDLGAKEWRNGPDLPFGVYDSQMVDGKNGEVILVAGFQFPFDALDTLYQLPHGGADAKWTKMEQKLKFKRREHLAFLVPDNIVDCS
jgi:hypothetical protein